MNSSSPSLLLLSLGIYSEGSYLGAAFILLGSWRLLSWDKLLPPDHSGILWLLLFQAEFIFLEYRWRKLYTLLHRRSHSGAISSTSTLSGSFWSYNCIFFSMGHLILVSRNLVRSFPDYHACGFLIPCLVPLLQSSISCFSCRLYNPFR